MARVVGISTDIKDSKEESQFVVCENFLSPNCGQDTFITKERVFVLFYFIFGVVWIDQISLFTKGSLPSM